MNVVSQSAEGHKISKELVKSGGQRIPHSIVTIVSCDGSFFRPGMEPAQEPQYFIMEKFRRTKLRDETDGEKDMTVRIACCGSDAASNPGKLVDWLAPDHKGDIVAKKGGGGDDSDMAVLWHMSNCENKKWENKAALLLRAISGRLSSTISDQLHFLLSHNIIPVNVDGDGVKEYKDTYCPACGNVGHIARDCAYFA